MQSRGVAYMKLPTRHYGGKQGGGHDITLIKTQIRSQMFLRLISRQTTRPNLLRSFANRLPRPPPKDLPPPETFSSTSRPRQYYSRPQPRDLPPYRVSAPPSFLLFFPYRNKSLTFCPVLRARARAYSVPGLAFSWSASAALACGPHS